MTKLLFALLLFSSPVMAEEPVEEVRWPTYCVRSATPLPNGKVMLDMPGWPYGMDDRPIEVDEFRVDMLLNTDYCTPDDPRMQ